MALDAYLTLQGEHQGDITAPPGSLDPEDSIMVIAVNHEVINPYDPATGLPAARFQHTPLVITKEIDRWTPLLMHAFVTNEKITNLHLRFWQRNQAIGADVQYYTIELLDAYIIAIRFEMLNNRYPENVQHNEREHVTFSYQNIAWTFEDGGRTTRHRW